MRPSGFLFSAERELRPGSWSVICAARLIRWISAPLVRSLLDQLAAGFTRQGWIRPPKMSSPSCRLKTASSFTASDG